MNGENGRHGSDIGSSSTQAIVQNGGYRTSQPGRRRARSYPHIKDLVAEASKLSVDRNSSISRLLQAAQDSLNQTKTAVEFMRPHLAYIEYLKAFDIVVSIIPIHRDYGALHDRGDWARQYKTLMRELESRKNMIEEIKLMILEDNARSGVQPAISQPADYRRSTSRPSSSSSYGIPTPTGTPPPPAFETPELRQEEGNQARPNPIYQQPLPGHSPHNRPAVRPKPDGLHGHAVAGVGNSRPDPLAERFAQLRIAQAPGNRSELLQTDFGHESSQARMPLPADLTTNSLPPSKIENQVDLLSNGSPTNRPTGPREMPSRPNGPPPPPKIPIDTSMAASLPKAPSPTYSPVTSIPGQSPYSAARTSTESNGSSVRNSSQFYQSGPDSFARTNSPLKRTAMNNSMASNLIHETNLSSLAPATDGNRQYQTPKPPENYNSYNTYASTSTTSLNSARNSKGRTIDLPLDTAVNAEKLFDYLKQCRVLLIDVRSREEFDQGHIFNKSIICVEPLSLRPGLSADELEESLVLSPDSEQALFEQRNEFDLVVFYDQRTASTNNTPALRSLFETLYDFNYNKQLKDGRPPVILTGGLEAWIDLVGPQSLQVSKTAAIRGSTTRAAIRRQPARLVRNQTVNANSSMEIRRRRLRAHKPMPATEQEEWLKRAMQEEIDPSRYKPTTDGENEGAEGEPEQPSPLAHTYEDFFRRFPDPSDVQQSMTRPMAPPPITPLRTVQGLPQPPSRPAPIAPRISYHGTSDNANSQLSLARQTSAQRPPLYFPAPQTRQKLPLTGLKNYGVTCYLNSTVQCLNATLPLTNYFLYDRWKDDVQRHNRGSSGNLLPFTYANLTKHIWANDTEIVGPRTFREFFRRQSGVGAEISEDRQHDAKEFLDLMLDYLHSDLNKNHDRTVLKGLTTEQERVRESLPVHQVSGIEWNRFLHRDSSLINSLFAGQHSSRLRCHTCNATSTLYETFTSISLELVPPNRDRTDITRCLNHYFKEELLEDPWDCPNCKTKRQASKKLTLTRLPQFLIVHFKRFISQINGRTYKLHTECEFPLYGLDMQPYMINRPPSSNANGNMMPELDTTPPFSYDAYGVIRHIGNKKDSGHYVTVVKDSARGKWFKFDDENVRELDIERLSGGKRLQNSEAYIVFYERSVPR